MTAADQYHFTVFGVEDDDGTIRLYLDDADSGIFRDGSIYDNGSEDDWRAVSTDEEQGRDQRIAEALAARLIATNPPDDLVQVHPEPIYLDPENADEPLTREVK